MVSVPFSASSQLWDAFDLEGVLKVGSAVLRIEYEGEWTRYDNEGKQAGTTEWKATTLDIPYGQIVSIEMEKRLLGSHRVLLRARSLHALREFPLAKGVHCVIPIPRRHFEDAKALVAEVEAGIADAEIRRLEQGSDGTALEP
ncbi:MAG: hypothetical protein ACT4P7_04315 [Gemmatimonadaceae bacterium]